LRDDQSLQLAADLGLDAVLVADPALLLAPAVDRRTDHAAAAPVVLVPRGGQAQLNAAVTELALQLAAEGVPQVAMSFHPAQDDEPVAALRAAVPQVGVWKADEPLAAVQLLAAARYVVSVRLHGSILAAAAGVGFAGLSYDPKVRGFLAQALAPSFDLPVDARALKRIALASPAPEPHAVQHLKRLSQHGIQWLGDALGGGAAAR
jgi:polysaccharide pyruvyl transferase WcaK-like protein